MVSTRVLAGASAPLWQIHWPAQYTVVLCYITINLVLKCPGHSSWLCLRGPLKFCELPRIGRDIY